MRLPAAESVSDVRTTLLRTKWEKRCGLCVTPSPCPLPGVPGRGSHAGTCAIVPAHPASTAVAATAAAMALFCAVARRAFRATRVGSFGTGADARGIPPFSASPQACPELAERACPELAER